MRRAVVERQRLARPGQWGHGYTPEDGLGLWQSHEYPIRDCSMDLPDMPLAVQDDAHCNTLRNHRHRGRICLFAHALP